MNKQALSILLLVLLSALVASIIVLSCVPPVSKDELVHHLAVPKLYLKHGGIYEIPWLPFSYYPMNLDLLYAIPLFLGNDIVPKFIHFFFALLTAWLIFGYLRFRLNTSYGLLGALFFLSIPIIVKLSITAYVDLGVIFFSTSALLHLLKWARDAFPPKQLVLSAVMCGLAMGTKYNGLLVCVALTLFVPFLNTRHSRGKHPAFLRSATQGLLYLFISLLIFSPWAIRNYHWTNNPIYPLYNKWFSTQKVLSEYNSSEAGEDGSPRGHFLYRAVIYGENGWDIALLPVRIFYEGKDGDPRFFDGKLTPFLLFLPFFAFLRRKEDSEDLAMERKVLVMFALLFFAIAFFSTDLRVRYIAPIIPPLVILSILGLHKLMIVLRSLTNRLGKSFGTTIVSLTVISLLAVNGQYLIEQMKYVNPWSYLLGEIGRDDYVANNRPEYAGIQYINRALPADSLVSMIFLGNRGYYFERNYIYGERSLFRAIRHARMPAEISSALNRSGVTHLFVYEPLFQKWARENFDEAKLVILDSFILEYTEMLFRQNNFIVLKLKVNLS